MYLKHVIRRCYPVTCNPTVLVAIVGMLMFVLCVSAIIYGFLSAILAMSSIGKTYMEYLSMENDSGLFFTMPEVTKVGNVHYGLDDVIDRKTALLVGKERTDKGFLTIGVPSIHRYNQSYLNDTLTSLFTNMDAENSDVTIVVFLADFNETTKYDQMKDILDNFKTHIDSGRLRIIEAPRGFYAPSFVDLTRRYPNYSDERLKWWAKQNYDYAFILKYSAEISDYYLQLEDDVITVPGYVSSIQDFIRLVEKNTSWVCLEFSHLGYIGKLYHSCHVTQLANMLMLFYQDQPPDFTYVYFNKLMGQEEVIIRYPTLFQHMGYYSSLSGKIQELKDGYFPNTTMFVNSSSK